MNSDAENLPAASLLDHEKMVANFFAKYQETYDELSYKQEIPVGLLPKGADEPIDSFEERVVNIYATRRAIQKAYDDGFLSERELFVFNGLYGRGQSGEAIGRELGVTGNRVSQIKSRALATLRHPRYGLNKAAGLKGMETQSALPQIDVDMDTTKMPTESTAEAEQLSDSRYGFGRDEQVPDSRLIVQPSVQHTENSSLSSQSHASSDQRNDSFWFRRRLWATGAAIGTAVATLTAGVMILQSEPPTGPAALYYTPDNNESTSPVKAELVKKFDDWNDPECDPSSQAVTPTETNGQPVETLVGSGIGRLGVMYFLHEHPEAWKDINYVVLFDPGSLEDFRSGCDSSINAAELIHDWLSTSPANTLVVLAGRQTADYENPLNGYAHAGIQNYFFSQLHDVPQGDQVIVCNYDNLSTEEMITNVGDILDQPKVTLNTCPSVEGQPEPIAWQP